MQAERDPNFIVEPGGKGGLAGAAGFLMMQFAQRDEVTGRAAGRAAHFPMQLNQPAVYRRQQELERGAFAEAQALGQVTRVEMNQLTIRCLFEESSKVF